MKFKQQYNNFSKNENQIIYNISHYGFQLINLKSKKFKIIPLEQLIVQIITEHPKPRFLEAIPFLLVKNKANTLKLLDLSSKNNINNGLGYFIETALLFKKNKEYQELLDYLKGSKSKEIIALYDSDTEFLTATSPKRVKDWNLLGRFFDEDFKALAEVYL